MKLSAKYFNLFSLQPLTFFTLIAILAATGAALAPARALGAEIVVSQNLIRSKIDALNANSQLEAALKARLLETYQTALNNLQSADTYQTQAKDYEQALRLAPAQIKDVKKNTEQLAAAAKTSRPESFEGIPTEEIEQRQIIERGKLSNVNDQLKRLESELSIQATRLPQIREESTALQEKLDSVDEHLKTLHPGEQKLESDAQTLLLRTQQMSLTAELKMLEMEAVSNPRRVELLKAQIDFLTLQSSSLLPTINLLEEVLSERRQQEAEKVQEALNKAEKELAGKPPAIQTVTRENIEFGRDLSTVTDKIARITAQQEKTDATNRQIDKDFKSAEQKISLAGVSPALGEILRQQRRDLPNTRQLEAQSEELQNETAEASFEQFRVEDRLKQLADINRALKAIMNEKVDKSLSAPERLQIQAELRMLLNNQKELLNKLLTSYSTYLRMIGELEFGRQQTVALTEKYAAFLDKRLLWVPSSPAVDKTFFADLYHAVVWFLAPRNWMQTLHDLTTRLLIHPLLGVFGILILAGLFALKQLAKKKLADISKKVSKPYSDAFSYTLEGLGFSLLLVAPVPLSFYFVGWLLTHELNISEFSHAVGSGLRAASIPLFSLQFFYSLMHPQGIVTLHLRWQDASRKTLRTLTGWLRFVAVPAIFLIAMTTAQSHADYNDGLGRLALIALLLAMSLALGKLFKFKKGFVEGFLREHPNSWITRLRFIWYPAIVLIPLVVSGFALAGYYTSALELEQKLIISIRLVLILIVLYDLALRWLWLINRKLGLIKARQKREAEQAAKIAGENPEDTAVLTLDTIDIPTINAQTRQMLQVLLIFGLVVGLWVVWADILPALGILDNVVLWRREEVIDGQETWRAITLVNALLAGFYTFIVFMAVRNLPGILEILLLKQLAVEPGNRYAVNQLARYVIITIGLILVANELGGSWRQIQWLVAALGVGLGFGLQEIFANLVSGIILLFERPIRVGDTVTVGDLSGKVCRIQIRATTIVDWDQKELIVPNKTFITNQLINWTLSDQVTRLVIEVGVAYGSDTALVHKLLSETVREAPLAMTEPEPSVYFLGFGDSSLNFSIRVFVNELSNRLPLTHDLHMRIERTLREHGIEIPFPQRDIHVRSILADAAFTKA